VSQQEAIAALAEAREALNDLADGLLPDDTTVYQAAARELAGSELTAGMAEALRKPDLGDTAEALDDLARDLDGTELDAEARQALAERLEQAADRLQEQNPALAARLREAAEALRRGDVEAAQEILREAAELLRRQEEFLQNTPLAEAARDAQQQMTAGQQELAQVGQEQTDLAAGEEQQSPPQASQSQPGTQQDSQAIQAGEGEPQAGADSGIPQEGEGAAPGPAQGDSQSGVPSGEQQGAAAGGEQSAEAGDQSPAEGIEDESSVGAGAGEGGAGVDTTTGILSETGAGEVPPAEVPEGGFYEYEAQNEPSTIGGESDQAVDVSGEVTNAEALPVLEGEFSENPAGESRLSYSGVFENYSRVVSDALESGRIPLDQRDVIHDYFSSLER